MNYLELDTPALIIDRDIMMKNCSEIQDYANRQNVDLRPHTKTHKMSKLALLQEEIGAKGIAVAKVGEAEIMASKGLTDIFIANEIVGDKKLLRIRSLGESINISFGLDSLEQAEMVERVFEGSKRRAQVLIEIEVGEERSGVLEEKYFIELLSYLKKCKNIYLKGVFSHDGHSYGAENLDECKKIHINSQKRTILFAELARESGFNIETVSIGSTPSLINKFEILDKITEIRPGTYIFMDASQAGIYGNYSKNAATILATVISMPTSDRLIIDVGAKGLTSQSRNKGITKTKGLGIVKGYGDISIYKVYDEHGVIYSEKLRERLKIGDKIEIIPNHICPVVNLHESAYLIVDGEVVEEIEVDCRGKLK